MHEFTEVPYCMRQKLESVTDEPRISGLAKQLVSQLPEIQGWGLVRTPFLAVTQEPQAGGSFAIFIAVAPQIILDANI